MGLNDYDAVKGTKRLSEGVKLKCTEGCYFCFRRR